MEIYVIQSISEIVLQDMPQEGIVLHNDCVIRVKNAGVRTVADAISPQIGSINANLIKEPGIGNCLQQQSPTPVAEPDARRLLMRSIVLTQQFLLSLWLIKDHSANSDEAHMVLLDRPTGSAEVYTQRVPFLITKADCGRTTTTFTKAEVDQAVAHFRALEVLIPQREWYPDAERHSALVVKSRLYRAIYSAEIARASAEIGVKIAFYCIAFEALFSTAKEAIAHQIAERAAVLIETDAAARLAFYQAIKKVYGIRSTVVHGDALSAEKLAEFKEISRRTDERLRKAIQRIFAEQVLLDLFTTKSPQEIEAFFLDRLLASAPPATAGRTPAT